MDELLLIDEVEAFVNGTLVWLRSAQGRSIAPWMMLNRLAHGDVAELYRVAHGTAPLVDLSSAPRRQRRAWAQAERWLAERVVGAGRDANQIHRVQQDVLVPLELRLVALSATRRCALGNVLADAIDALDDDQRNR